MLIQPVDTTQLALSYFLIHLFIVINDIIIFIICMLLWSANNCNMQLINADVKWIYGMKKRCRAQRCQQFGICGFTIEIRAQHGYWMDFNLNWKLDERARQWDWIEASACRASKGISTTCRYRLVSDSPKANAHNNWPINPRSVVFQSRCEPHLGMDTQQCIQSRAIDQLRMFTERIQTNKRVGMLLIHLLTRGHNHSDSQINIEWRGVLANEWAHQQPLK